MRFGLRSRLRRQFLAVIAEDNRHARLIDASGSLPINEFTERVGLGREPPTVRTEKHQGTHECRAFVAVEERAISAAVKEVRGSPLEAVAVQGFAIECRLGHIYRRTQQRQVTNFRSASTLSNLIGVARKNLVKRKSG